MTVLVHYGTFLVHFIMLAPKCHVFYILVCKRKIFLSILMVGVICVHFSQLIYHC